jgi:hypothetical protein
VEHYTSPTYHDYLEICSCSNAIAVQYYRADQEFADSGDAYVINSNFAGLCQSPLHQMIATLTIILNHQAITIRPSQLFDKFEHYNFDRETQKSTMSSTPCYPDQAITYELTAGRITSEFALYEFRESYISATHGCPDFHQQSEITISQCFRDCPVCRAIYRTFDD